MDINCGTIVEGEETIAEVGERIYQMILDMASGKKTKSEEFGYGSQGICPLDNWLHNVTLHNITIPRIRHAHYEHGKEFLCLLLT